MRDCLRHVYDIERLAARIAYGSVNARELVQLKRSLQNIPEIASTVEQVGLDGRWLKQSEQFADLVAMLEKSLVDDPRSH